MNISFVLPLINKQPYKISAKSRPHHQYEDVSDTSEPANLDLNFADVMGTHVTGPGM